jgi:hypothetical protein
MSTKVKNDKTELGGMLSGKVSLRKVNNRLHVDQRPERKLLPLTAKQEDHKEKFLEAADYAKEMMENEESRAHYSKGLQGRQTAYGMAVADYLTAPKLAIKEPIQYKGLVGDFIRVRASKEGFEIAKVRVAIRNAAGDIIEEGEAVKARGLTWKYQSTVANPSVAGTTIEATVIDRPANETTLTKVL